MIEFNGVSKHYADRAAVSDLTLHLAKGEITVLTGTSGCGKSTTLKMINRLTEHDKGTIHFAGEEISRFNPQALRRRMGYVIQSTGLFPHWTVEKNIATVPLLLGWTKSRIQARVSELLALMNMEEAFRTRYPHQLSGGQQQRIGVARALAADPEVLLMDEPFGALDPVTRGALQQELSRIHRLSGKTIVLVTHDIDEALALADRLVLMDKGQIVQQGAPTELLTRPVNAFVSRFFGRNDWGIRLLSLGTAGQLARRDEWLDEEPIAAEMTLREALSVFIAKGVDRLAVTGNGQYPPGVLYFADLLRQRKN